MLHLMPKLIEIKNKIPNITSLFKTADLINV